MPCAICHMPYAICHMPYAMCHVPYAICHMPYAICHMPYAMCHVPCAMPYARCTVGVQTMSSYNPPAHGTAAADCRGAGAPGARRRLAAVRRPICRARCPLRDGKPGRSVESSLRSAFGSRRGLPVVGLTGTCVMNSAARGRRSECAPHTPTTNDKCVFLFLFGGNTSPSPPAPGWLSAITSCAGTASPLAM